MPSIYTFPGGAAGVAQAIAAVNLQFGGQISGLMVAVSTGSSAARVSATDVASLSAGLTSAAIAGSTIVLMTIDAKVAPVGAPSYVDFAALGAAFWIDASNPASYSAAGATLSGLKSLISGSALSAITGAPLINTDVRNGKPGFWFPAAANDCVEGADAPYLAAVTGTDKPFCSITVCHPGDVTFTAVTHSTRDSGNTGNGNYEGAYSGGNWFFERDGSPSGPAKFSQSAWPVEAGLSVVVRRSSDGLNIKTSVNGGTEMTATITSAGAIAPNIVGIGIASGSVRNFPFYGYIKEHVFFGADQPAATIAVWVSALKRKWIIPPVVQFVGDSITTAQNATLGGMPALLVQSIRAAGGVVDVQGPFHVGMPDPYRHSGVSGNTCVQMNARVTSATQGLGSVGGGTKGYYARTRLVCLFAGTNPGTPTTAAQTAADYTTLLNNIATQLNQVGSAWKIAVTTITDIFTNLSYSSGVNALLPAIWDAFDIANPANTLIRWNATLANPNNGTTTYYVDGTHPNDAGYVRMVNDPAYGLAQAVAPYLMSIQPS